MLAGVYGNCLYIRRGSSIYDGKGLLLGVSSPFKKDGYFDKGAFIKKM